MKNLLWTDTETTGLSADRHGIVEIGILIDIDGEIRHKIRTTMKPTGRLCNSRSLEINGFTRDQISNLDPWENVYIPLMENIESILVSLNMTEPFIIAGQNVPFDNRFICSWERQCGSTTKSDWSSLTNQDKNSFIDTQKIFKELQKRGIVPSHEKANLGNICRYFGVNLKNAHSALGDITGTRDVYYKMMEGINEKSD